MTSGRARLSRRAAMATALAALAMGPGAQPRAAAPMSRLGFLGPGTGDPISLRTIIEPLRQGLRDLGYVEERNLVIDVRWADARYERLPGLLDELLKLGPDVLMTSEAAPAMAARDAVKTLPIVAVAVDDPVGMGLAQSHARPGGNITGIAAAFTGLLQKRLQLLKEVVPTAQRMALLYNPDSVKRESMVPSVARWKQGLGINVQFHPIRGPDDFEPAFAALARERAEAVVVLADSMTWVHRAKLGELCTQHRLPSVWGGGIFLDAGGLLSYQGDFPAMYRRAAVFVDKILKGTPPGEIPFEQGTKLELVVNLKAAKALGISIPRSVLVSADEVIE
ncbi:ABC transporter substrate-binding protein [Variovorax defluvii]|uniref:ABC transporter substrate-binding protein n=1 Tax=Variovorax defluvii TaxID=913761 RepID=A0ABP8HEE5_9BURK